MTTSTERLRNKLEKTELYIVEISELAQVSQAISLKRIADALENLVLLQNSPIVVMGNLPPPVDEIKRRVHAGLKAEIASRRGEPLLNDED